MEFLVYLVIKQLIQCARAWNSDERNLAIDCECWGGVQVETLCHDLSLLRDDADFPKMYWKPVLLCYHALCHSYRFWRVGAIGGC